MWWQLSSLRPRQRVLPWPWRAWWYLAVTTAATRWAACGSNRAARALSDTRGSATSTAGERSGECPTAAASRYNGFLSPENIFVQQFNLDLNHFARRIGSYCNKLRHFVVFTWGLSGGDTPKRYPAIWVLKSEIMTNFLRTFLGKM